MKLLQEALAEVKEGRLNYLKDAIAIRQTGRTDDDLEPEDLDADYSSDDAVDINDEGMH